MELLGRIQYNDGLDQYRLTAKELVEEFVKRGADAVFAFQVPASCRQNRASVGSGRRAHDSA